MTGQLQEHAPSLFRWTRYRDLGLDFIHGSSRVISDDRPLFPTLLAMLLTSPSLHRQKQWQIPCASAPIRREHQTEAELPFDIPFILEPLVPGKETISTIGSFEFMVKFGCPMYVHSALDSLA